MRVEEQEQTALIDWAKLWAIDGGKLSQSLFAIPNGAMLGGDQKLRSIQAGRLKRSGMKPGVADLFLSKARQDYHGFYIEMKKPRQYFRSDAEIRRAVSAEQYRFAAQVIDDGYLWRVCFGFEEARADILRYFSGPRFKREEVLKGARLALEGKA